VRDRLSPLVGIIAAARDVVGDDTPNAARRVAGARVRRVAVLVTREVPETVAPQRFARLRYFLRLVRVAPPRPRNVVPDSLRMRCTKP
jgi:hypothetical protein